MEKRRVTVESGELQGCFGYDPRITVFKGIPYAAPPIGDLRWRAPQPVEKWDGVRIADNYGPMSIQDVPGLDPKEFWTKELHPSGPEFEMSEDCLYLNVFTPAKIGNEKLPVLVYIHGGGLMGGYPYEIEFDWEHVARKGIVVVAVAYRLGVLGFLSHPWLSAEHPDEPKGNYGYLDQLAAIKWTGRNIAAFGGDPEKITIAGQSAGAGSVLAQLSSPMAQGAFQAAIVQSGIIMDFHDTDSKSWVCTLEEAEKTGKEFFEKAGFHNLEEARACPALKLHELQKKLASAGLSYGFTPPIDHIFMKEAPVEAMVRDHWGERPVIFGYTKDELKMFNHLSGSSLNNMKEYLEVAELYGDKKDEFLKITNCHTDEDVQKLGETDAYMTLVASTIMGAFVRNSQGHRTYIYEFACDIPGEDNPGAYHGAELAFAYDALARMWRPFTGKSYDMARYINSYWMNFVKNTDPNGVTNFGEELPKWDAFTADKPMKMNFTDKCEETQIAIDPLMKLRYEISYEK